MDLEISEIEYLDSGIQLYQEKNIFSDASSFSGAGFTYEEYTKVVHYMWNLEKAKSSTRRLID